jgi:hypothetical protein
VTGEQPKGGIVLTRPAAGALEWAGVRASAG